MSSPALFPWKKCLYDIPPPSQTLTPRASLYDELFVLLLCADDAKTRSNARTDIIAFFIKILLVDNGYIGYRTTTFHYRASFLKSFLLTVILFDFQGEIN